MPSAHLSAVLRYLRRPFGTEVSSTLTDDQLLERFGQGRDQAAFYALVQRHGSMVLKVAVRILKNFHDAEDVFQAAFLVLAKQAESIRRRRDVSGWLYRVTFRLALKLKADVARRLGHERRAVTMERTTVDSNLNREELRLVLDQELDRLPEKYRAPLVIHYMQEKSKQETALQLGWSNGTVSGRLARGRQLLRKRLVRRGFVLSTAGLTAVLDEATPVTAASPFLVNATSAAAAQFAAGATSGVPVVAARLARGMLEAMAWARFKLVLCLVAGGIVFAVSTAVAYRLLEPRGNGNWATEGQAQTAQPQFTAATVQEGGADQSDDALVHLSASGRVVDEQDKPIAGATVYLRETGFMRHLTKPERKGYTDILARAVSDANGRFAFNGVKAESMNLSPSNSYRHPWTIVVTAKGFGLVWHNFTSTNEQDLRLVMGPETRLHGRLLDSSGKPAAGVRVQVERFEDQYDPHHRGYSPKDKLELWSTRLPLATITDPEGRFDLHGLPKMPSVSIVTSDPRFARTFFQCATIEKSDIERLNSTEASQESKLLVDGFTATLKRATSVSGKVTYVDTGKPVAGATVTFGVLATLTDDQGRYSFGGLATGRLSMTVRPPGDANYLGQWIEEQIPDGATWQRNFALEPGCVVFGQLREKETGRPLRVANVGVGYHSEKSPDGIPNGTYINSPTGPDGSFRVVVPPGKGKLVSSEKIPGCIRPDLIGERGEVVDVPIETKLGQTLRGKDLLFQRGMVVNGRVLDPDGRPLAGAEFVGLVEQAPSRADGNFALSGLFPEESNHYLVLHRQKGLAAVTSLEPAADSNAVPLSIVLRPTRTASGSVVDENGQPVAASRVWLRVNIRFHETARGFSYASPMVRGPQVTDSAGKYTFSGPAEEGRYSLDVAAMGYATSQASFHIESAKDCTVPDIVLLRNDLTFDGSVVDQTGKPVEGVEVDIIPRNPRVASSGYQWMKTTKEGRFHFDHVTDGAYRLIATLWKPTGQKDERGHPINEAVARTELNVIAADKTARIVLQLP